MIPVRSLAEAAVYALATGAAPYERSTPAPGEHHWRCWWRDEPRDLRFVERPSDGPSEVLEPEAFLSVARSLLRGAPPVVEGLPASAHAALLVVRAPDGSVRGHRVVDGADGWELRSNAR